MLMLLCPIYWYLQTDIIFLICFVFGWRGFNFQFGFLQNIVLNLLKSLSEQQRLQMIVIYCSVLHQQLAYWKIIPMFSRKYILQGFGSQRWVL